MILYNTLMGFCAGLILILTARGLRVTAPPNSSGASATGYALAYLVLGVPLVFLSALMATTWPLTVNPPINIAFAEPSLMLGLSAVVFGVMLWRGDLPGNRAALRPLTAVVSALGVMLVMIASAIFNYGLVGDAPSLEPITGQFAGWENTTFALVYLVAGIGTTLAWWANRAWARTVMYWCWMASGVFFLLFSLLNYRTHIGLLINLEQGTNYRW